MTTTRLLTSAQVGALLGVTAERVTEMHRRPRGLPEPLPKGVRIGKGLRWRADDIDAWIDRVWGHE